MSAVELTPTAPNELDTENLRASVAVDLIPLIDTMIETHDGCQVIVTDVVDCWLRLPAEVRAAYYNAPSYRGLSRFVGDYVDVIDGAWVERCSGNPDEMSDEDAEELCRRGWRQHEAEVRRRLAAGEPPSDAWLQRVTADERGDAPGDPDSGEVAAMTITGPFAGDPRRLTPEQVERYRALLIGHADDLLLGVCVLCNQSGVNSGVAPGRSLSVRGNWLRHKDTMKTEHNRSGRTVAVQAGVRGDEPRARQ